MKHLPLLRFVAMASLALAAAAQPGLAEETGVEDGYVVIDTAYDFATLDARLRAAVEASGLFVVTQASASVGAARRGVAIPGDKVIGVYRNDFAVRMLQASVAAGIEAPLRYHLTENADGSASLRYYLPSAVFAPYGSPELDAMAQELDVLFGDIADTATAAP